MSEQPPLPQYQPPPGGPSQYQPPPGWQPTPSAYQQPLGQQPPPPRSTNGFAIASLVLGLLADPLFLSVIFGIIALRQIKRNRAQGGRGMAIAGLVLSGLWVVPLALGIIAGALSPTENVYATQVKVGACLANAPTGKEVKSVDTISCDQPHSAEVFAQLPVSGNAYPGQSGFDQYTQKCNDELAAYSSTATKDPGVDITLIYPLADAWQQGDHHVTCIATLSAKRTGSIAKS
jgi:hypothetical protein